MWNFIVRYNAEREMPNCFAISVTDSSLAFIEDLKRRIDETAKYIKPDEGTLPFAFMFIPAEGIYYDLLVNEVGAVKVLIIRGDAGVADFHGLKPNGRQRLGQLDWSHSSRRNAKPDPAF